MFRLRPTSAWLRRWAGVATVTSVTAVGAFWYWLIEGFTVGDAAYQSVITVSTVGFGEVQPLDASGRAFTSGLIIVGVAAMVYALGGFAGHLIETSLDRMTNRRTERSMDKLDGHLVICGFGSVGMEVSQLAPADRVVVVIEADSQRAQLARAAGLNVIEGDATTDETLMRAGVDRAAQLVICLGGDADAISVVLSARHLAPELRIVARAHATEAENKLRLAGADHVVSLARMGAQRLAADALDPSIGSFLDAVVHDPAIAVELRAVPVVADLAAEDLSSIEEDTSIRVLATLRRSGHVDETRSASPGDQLIVSGSAAALALLDQRPT